jgi:hypothetical protein
MKQVNLVEYLELISKGDEIYEIARDLVCSSGKNDSYYINISLEVLGDEFVKEDPLREAEAGREIEIDRKYWEYFERWAENLEFEELSEDIKEEIIKDIAEDDIELKIIKSVIENDFDLFLQIIKKYTYANINV